MRSSKSAGTGRPARSDDEARRPVLAVIAVLVSSTAVVAFASSLLVGPLVGPRAAPDHSDDAGRAAARRFLDRYLDPDGRVVRRDQGGDSVSEGQAYAMLLAQAVGDRRRFDLAWEWARRNLQRADALLAWRWADRRVQDPMPAADADLDAAWALVLAATRFDDAALRHEGLRMAAAVLDNETVRVDGTGMDGTGVDGAASEDILLVAGPWAREAKMVNPSYVSPGALTTMAQETDDPRWPAMALTSRRLLAQLVGPERPLPPDWSRLGPTGALEPAPAPDGKGEAPRYGLDAARLLPRLASCAEVWADVAAAGWPALAASPGTGTAMATDLGGSPIESVPHPAKAVGAAAAAHAAGDDRARDALLAQAEDLDRGAPTYYGAAWVAMGRLLLTSSLGGSCA
jgi:endoglucanase